MSAAALCCCTAAPFTHVLSLPGKHQHLLCPLKCSISNHCAQLVRACAGWRLHQCRLFTGSMRALNSWQQMALCQEADHTHCVCVLSAAHQMMSAAREGAAFCIVCVWRGWVRCAVSVMMKWRAIMDASGRRAPPVLLLCSCGYVHNSSVSYCLSCIAYASDPLVVEAWCALQVASAVQSSFIVL